ALVGVRPRAVAAVGEDRAEQDGLELWLGAEHTPGALDGEVAVGGGEVEVEDAIACHAASYTATAPRKSRWAGTFEYQHAPGPRRHRAPPRPARLRGARRRGRPRGLGVRGGHQERG